jgi:hypothetical protein
MLSARRLALWSLITPMRWKIEIKSTRPRNTHVARTGHKVKNFLSFALFAARLWLA